MSEEVLVDADGEQTQVQQNVRIGWCRTRIWDKNREHVDDPKPEKAGTQTSSLLQNKNVKDRTHCQGARFFSRELPLLSQEIEIGHLRCFLLWSTLIIIFQKYILTFLINYTLQVESHYSSIFRMRVIKGEKKNKER